MSKCIHLTFVVFLCLGIIELNFKVGLSLGCQEYQKLPIESFLLKLLIEKETFIGSCWAEEFKLGLNLLPRRK